MKRRYSLLKSASNPVRGVDIIFFFYAGINCHLKIKWKDDEKKIFFLLH